MTARKKNLILSILTVFFADVIYFIWMPYPKSILRTNNNMFVYDIITGCIFFAAFAVILLFSVKSIAKPGKILIKKQLVASMVLCIGMQIVFDILRCFLSKLFSKWYGEPIVSDLFTVFGTFILVLTLLKVSGEKINCRKKFFTISILTLLIALVVAVILDVREIQKLFYVSEKYLLFSPEFNVIVENEEFLYGIRNFILDLVSGIIVLVVLYFSTPMVKVENEKDIYTRKEHFFARILAIILLSFVVCGAKVLILPQNSLQNTNISHSKSKTTIPDFDYNRRLTRHSRSVSRSEGKEVYCMTRGEIFYGTKQILGFYMDGDFQKNPLERIDIHGTEVVIVCDDEAIAYLREGEPYAVTFEEIEKEDYDEILLGTCEKLLEEGRLECFEYISKYIMKYDPEFAKPYIERYCTGEFTDSELQQIGSIRPEYITKCAQQVTAG